PHRHRDPRPHRRCGRAEGGGAAMTQVLYDVPGPKARKRSRIVSILGAVVIIAILVALVVALAAPRVTASGAVLPGMLDPSRWDIFGDRDRKSTRLNSSHVKISYAV